MIEKQRLINSERDHKKKLEEQKNKRKKKVYVVNENHAAPEENLIKSDRMVFDIYGPAFNEPDMFAYLFGPYVVYHDNTEEAAFFETKITAIGAQNILRSQEPKWKDQLVSQQKTLATNLKGQMKKCHKISPICKNELFMDLVSKMLVIDPKKRITPKQIMSHPFVRN